MQLSLLKLLDKWGAPELGKIWYAHIKYSLIFVAWLVGLAYLMPYWLAGLIALWIVIGLITTPRDDTWLKLIQPEIIWILPKQDQEPDDPDKES